MQRVTFLGESIHGVAEFTDYKRRWLETRRAEALAVVFEADHAGMMRSRQSGEPAEAVLANFPKIHRTREMRDMLALVIESGFPFFGADVVVRNKEARFSGDLAVMHDRQITRQGEIYEREDWAEQRDAYMAGVTAQVCADFPDHHVVGGAGAASERASSPRCGCPDLLMRVFWARLLPQDRELRFRVYDVQDETKEVEEKNLVGAAATVACPAFLGRSYLVPVCRRGPCEPQGAADDRGPRHDGARRPGPPPRPCRCDSPLTWPRVTL